MYVVNSVAVVRHVGLMGADVVAVMVFRVSRTQRYPSTNPISDMRTLDRLARVVRADT